jgi:hypothetical protein
VTPLPAPETFLSGEHGEVGGRRGSLRRAADGALDRWLAASGTLRRIDAWAATTPQRDVLAAGIYRPPGGAPHVHSARHRLRTAFGPMEAGRGKFDRLGDLVDARADWLLVIDDDVELPPRFLDRFLAVCERLGLDLAQPAQTLASHAAWRVVRRRPFSIARETRFVEIGPVTAMRRHAAEALLPFPPLRYGWGLDLHWAALADEHGWRRGIVDALPVRHEFARVGAAYSPGAAIDEAQRFLADRPYLPSAAAREVLAVHR